MTNRPWHHRFLPRFLPLLALLFFCTAAFVLWSAVLDDAYISMQYARNLVSGQGLVFNPGERVEGFSNPLWVLLVAAFGAIGIPWTIVPRLLGMLAGMATLLFTGWWLYRLFALRSAEGSAAPHELDEYQQRQIRKRQSTKQRKGKKAKQSSGSGAWLRWVDLLAPASALAVALVALHPGFGFYAVAGLETTFYGLLILLGVGLHLLDLAQHNGPTLRRCYIPLALATITRPEGALFLGAVWLHRFVLSWRKNADDATASEGTSSGSVGHEVLAFALALLVPLGYLLFRVLYYGEWLPNTFYAKPGTFWQAPGEAFAYITGFLRGHVTAPPLLGSFYRIGTYLLWAGGILLLGLTVLALWRGPLRREARFVGGAVCLYMLFILYSSGDWMAQYRFFQPILPLIYVLPALGLAALTHSWRRLIGFFLLLLLPLYASQAISFWRVVDANQAIDHAHRSQNNVKMARWMNRHLKPGSTVLTDEVGAVGFYSGLRVLDLWGLIDRKAARILHRHAFNPNNAVPPRVPVNDPTRRKVQALLAKELLKRRPEYVLVDYNGPVPRGKIYRPDFVNRLTMWQLFQAVRHRYLYVRGFSMMTFPFKTFLLFRRPGVPEPKPD